MNDRAEFQLNPTSLPVAPGQGRQRRSLVPPQQQQVAAAASHCCGWNGGMGNRVEFSPLLDNNRW